MPEAPLPRVPVTVEDLLETPRLAEPQRRFLYYLARTRFPEALHLCGGAALAAGYLGHRLSDDLDLFGPDPVPLKRLLRFMQALPGLDALQWLLPRDRTTFLITWDDGSQVKVEYRQFPFAPLQPPAAVGPLRVASMADLLADKLYALIERRYELDRVDIALMLRAMPGVTVARGVRASERKFGLPPTMLASVRARLAAPLPAQAPDALRIPFPPAEMAALLAARDPAGVDSA